MSSITMLYNKATKQEYFDVKDILSLANAMEKMGNNHEAQVIFVSHKDFDELFLNKSLMDFITPFSRLEAIQTNKIGCIFGITIYSDKFLPEKQKFIKKSVLAEVNKLRSSLNQNGDQ